MWICLRENFYIPCIYKLDYPKQNTKLAVIGLYIHRLDMKLMQTKLSCAMIHVPESLLKSQCNLFLPEIMHYCTATSIVRNCKIKQIISRVAKMHLIF